MQSPPCEPMVFNRMISILYDLIGLRRYPRIRDAKSLKVSRVDASASVDGIVLESPAVSSSAETSEVEGQLCCVCLLELEAGEDLHTLPCQHKFHKACIKSWLDGYSKTCPLCRFSMGEEGKSYSREEQLTEDMVVWFSSFHAAGF